MSEVTIRLRDHGPILVEGPVKIVDGEGKEYTLDASKPAVALCRCGASSNKPFCDGAHRGCGFQSEVRVPDA
jgi:CDGSH-type Zn-finger protein